MKSSSCLLFSFLVCHLTQNLIGKYLLVQIQEDNQQDEDTNAAKKMHPGAWRAGTIDNKPRRCIRSRFGRNIRCNLFKQFNIPGKLNGFRSIQGKDLRDLHCKDYSHRCISISASSCRVPIEANLCKRSCGLCNGVQPPGFPTYPISTPVPIPVEYDKSISTKWCKSNKGVDGIRNGCMDDKQCLDNARGQCDNDPDCYGVSWYQNDIGQKIKLCLSRDMEPKNDGWRTMMKSEARKTTTESVTTTIESPTQKDCKTINIGELKADRCSLPFQDCRPEILQQNKGNCVERTECLPSKHRNGTILRYWCSTKDTYNGYMNHVGNHNFGICEDSCPRSST